jgi:bifunctional DNA-binding transcriptional regulator/antitoxin component of YhaV-PrlF toxin-antitoxin module
VECYGLCKIGGSGQLHVPIEARRALDIDEETVLMVFADPGNRQLVVTVKPPGRDLFDLATRPRA